MNHVILVAGGSGLRMGADVPKQFLEVAGKPILMHTIDRFLEFDPSIEIILALPHDQFDFWKMLCVKHQFSRTYTLVKGGRSRFESVKNGLDALQATKGVVAVHDGVRPFVSVESIQTAFEVATVKGSAVLFVGLKDSIRYRSGLENKSVSRNDYVLIQTPQVFDLALLKKAYETEELIFFTDDASVFEHAGHRIALVEGSYENIKITTPEDLLVAEVYAKKIAKEL